MQHPGVRADDFPVDPDDLWRKNAEKIRRFLSDRADYEQLCAEVAYTLSKLLETEQIKAAAITSRAKTVESFLEKIDRKGYGDPFVEIRDFAGARVVCFYRDDIPKVEAIIKSAFIVDDVDAKVDNTDFDRFGYSAMHFTVRLSGNSTGARYDHLREKRCEVQVRTVLQDAWAIFSHHLVYKHESDIPKSVRREINAVAAILECADVLFQGIRDKREQYINSISHTATKGISDSIEINLDSLRAYLQTKFPQLPTEGSAGAVSRVISKLPSDNYLSLKEVGELFDKTASARKAMVERFGATIAQSAVSELFRALYLVHPDLLEKSIVNAQTRKAICAASSLVG